MNKILLADFKHFRNEKELLGSSRFWTDLVKSRVDVNQEYGENLLRWSCDMRQKFHAMSENACVGSYRVQHFLDTYITSTELEAYEVLRKCQDMNADGGPIHSFKKVTTNPGSSKQEFLSLELDSLTKNHKECVKTLQEMKEKRMKAIAASSSYEKQIAKLRSELEKVSRPNTKSHKVLERRICSLESKLSKQNEKERFQKLQFENLLKEEHDLVERLRKTSDHACQEACDQQGGQLDTLISVLRDLVTKAGPSPHDNSDRTRPLQDILDDVTLNIEDSVNTMCKETSRSYIFPDIRAWHETFGFLEKLPSPVIRPSDRDISKDPKKGLTVDLRLAQHLMSSVGQTLPSRKLWVYKFGRKSTKEVDVNNNTGTRNILATDGDDVSLLDDVYVRAVCPFKATHPEHLELRPGMLVKQKFPKDIRGMAFGWTRSYIGGPKKYGFYPANYVTLD